MNNPHIIGGLPPNQKRFANLAREYFGEGEDPNFRAMLLPLQERLFEEVQRTKKELAEAAPRYERNQNRYRQLVEEKQAEVCLWYYAAQAQMREGIEAKLSKAAEDWKAKREPLQELLALQRYQNKYNSMSKADLENEISISEDGETGRLVQDTAQDPDELDTALQAASKAGVGPAIVDAAKKRIAEKRLREPWLKDGEAPTLVKLHKLLSAEYGKVRVLAQGGMDDCDILGPKGLFDDSPIDHEEMESDEI